MGDIDSYVYDKLVSQAQNNRLLENLLAYHHYKTLKFDVAYNYFQANRQMPSESHIQQLVGTIDVLEKCRIAARNTLGDQITKELKSNNEGASWFSNILEKTFTSLAARIIFQILAMITTYLLGRYSLPEFLSFLHPFLNIKK